MLDSSSIPILNGIAWLAAAAVMASACLLGSLICLRCRLPDGLDAFLIRLTVGLAALPAFVLIAGQIPGAHFFRGLWFALAVAGVIFGIYHGIRTAHGDAVALPVEIPPSDSGERRIPPTVVLAAMPFVFWMAYLLGPLGSPPLNYDALEYHLGVIPHIFELGRIDPIPHVFYSAQPIATEMLYTLASVLEGTPWADSTGYVQWFLIGLSGLLLWRVLERVGVPRPIALLFPFGMLTHPIIVRLELDRMTDLTGAVLLLGGWLLWLGRPRAEGNNQPDRAIYIILGLLAGGAISSKWTNAGTSAVGIAMAPAVGLLLKPKPESESSRLKAADGFSAAGLFALGAAVILTPWILWVWRETGNPIAPFGAQWFPTERWGPENLGFLLETHRPLTMLGGEFWKRLLQRMVSPAIGLWPLFLAVALTLAAGIRPSGHPDQPRFGSNTNAGRSLLIAGAISIMVGLLLWGRLRHAADRFLAPVIAMEFLMLGAAMAMLIRQARERWIRLAAPGVFLVFCGVGLERPVYPLAGATIYWDRALGRTTAAQFLKAGLGATTDFFEAANALPEGSRLMAIGEARRYYFRHPVTLASVFDRHPIAEVVENSSDVESIRSALRQSGYTHLIVNEYETARLLDFHPPPILEADPDFMAERAERNYAALVGRYPGYSEFGAKPLADERRALYVAFLREMKVRASWLSGAGGPAFWIAPL